MACTATVHGAPFCEAMSKSVHPFMLAPVFDNEPHELSQLSCLQSQTLTDRFDSNISVAIPSWFPSGAAEWTSRIRWQTVLHFVRCTYDHLTSHERMDPLG